MWVCSLYSFSIKEAYQVRYKSLGLEIGLLGLVGDSEHKMLCSLSATKPNSSISKPTNYVHISRFWRICPFRKTLNVIPKWQRIKRAAHDERGLPPSLSPFLLSVQHGLLLEKSSMVGLIGNSCKQCVFERRPISLSQSVCCRLSPASTTSSSLFPSLPLSLSLIISWVGRRRSVGQLVGCMLIICPAQLTDELTYRLYLYKGFFAYSYLSLSL